MSHAIRAQDRVWLTDVVDGEGLDERIAALGQPVGVVQLLDRHKRDCAAVAGRLGLPLHVTPFTDVEGAPFVAFPIVRQRFWREVALWFSEQRILSARTRSAASTTSARPASRSASTRPCASSRRGKRSQRSTRSTSSSATAQASTARRRPKPSTLRSRPRDGAPAHCFRRQVDGSPLGTVVRIGHNAASPLSATAEATRNAPPYPENFATVPSVSAPTPSAHVYRGAHAPTTALLSAAPSTARRAAPPTGTSSPARPRTRPSRRAGRSSSARRRSARARREADERELERADRPECVGKPPAEEADDRDDAAEEREQQVPAARSRGRARRWRERDEAAEPEQTRGDEQPRAERAARREPAARRRLFGLRLRLAERRHDRGRDEDDPAVTSQTSG